MTKEQFTDVIAWQLQTFPFSNPLSKISHLTEELDELVSDIKENSPKRILEYADCFILLFGAAASDGMNYDDIVNAINQKMEINKSRSWGEPDENGVARHIK
jgi:NTP pyrophosphatase (non-canonical NTP hydrolase)